MDWLEAHWALLWAWMRDNPWKSIAGAIVLFGAIGRSVIWVYDLLEKRDARRKRKREERKEAIRKEIRRLKAEYRKEHEVPGSFSLGADYYVERIEADKDLIREIVRTEGDKER